MARYFTTFSRRAEAYTAAHRVCGRDGSATLYVVSEAQPPMYLVGPPTVDMEQAGATPLLTLVQGLPDGDVRARNAELEETVALLEKQLAAQTHSLRRKRLLQERKCDCWVCSALNKSRLPLDDGTAYRGED